MDKLFGGELHAKRVLSLANAILGLLPCGTMKVYAIGQGLAEAQGRVTKHAIKLVDRLLLLNALAIFLMTLLGTAGERLGFDRLLKANTVKYRTHSLFRQGGLYYGLIPKMPQARLRPLICRFTEMLTQQPTAKDVLAMA